MFDPAVYISGYSQLSPLGVGFYPVNPDKSPAVSGKLSQSATVDPIKIRFWAEHCHRRSFAARILRRSRLIVIDTEAPFKHPDRPGPDGELVLYSLLEDAEITLPPCPVVQTASGGFHRYLIIPKGFRIRPRVGLFPGIDVLAAVSNVILPGSRTSTGDYRALRSFEESPIPEAPRALMKLIRDAQTPPSRQSRLRASPSSLMVGVDTSEVSRRQWYLLFRNRVFQSFWNRRGKAGDATDSAYEFHLAKACFCCGLNHRQTECVLVNWRRKHALNRDLRQLHMAVIPKAYSEVEPWIERWHAEREARKRANKAATTANLILSHMNRVDDPQQPAAIAAGLGIPRERVKKAMQRMASNGKLVRTPRGYELVTSGDI